MTIGSLFSGIGGLELGLELCGLGPVIWQAESDPFCRAVLARRLRSLSEGFGGWEVEPAVGRVADGFPGRVDQLRALGNAVVPQQAAAAFRILRARFE